MVVAGVSVAVAGVLLRRLRHRRLSVMVAGDETSIARAASAWAGSSDINVVGGFLLGDERDRGMLTESFGVPMVGHEANLSERVAAWDVDLVVVAPGAEVSSRQLRSLGWELETSQAGLAVLGLVEDVAPHRIEVTRLAGNTLLEVGASRPSAFLRAVRCVLDRVLGALLLLVFSPADPGHRAWRSAGTPRGRRSSVRPGSGSTGAVHDVQVPQHAQGRGQGEVAAGRRQRARRDPLQDARGPPDHPCRQAPAPYVDGRAPAAAQRRAWRDVAGRAASGPARRGGAVRRARPAVGSACVPA